MRGGLPLEIKVGIQAEDTELPHRMIAGAQRESDPFVDAFIRSTPQEEQASFSDSKIAAMFNGLARTRPVSRHLFVEPAVRPEWLVYE